MDYLELLEQQKVWRSNEGVIKLKKMSRPHRLHLLRQRPLYRRLVELVVRDLQQIS